MNAVRVVQVAAASVFLALLLLFATAYAITGEYRNVFAGVICGVAAWIMAEPVKRVRADEAADRVREVAS